MGVDGEEQLEDGKHWKFLDQRDRHAVNNLCLNSFQAQSWVVVLILFAERIRSKIFPDRKHKPLYLSLTSITMIISGSELTVISHYKYSNTLLPLYHIDNI
jgi:hypothetical protein